MPELMNIDLEDIRFQQDSITTHFANDTIDLKFHGRIIFRNGGDN